MMNQRNIWRKITSLLLLGLLLLPVLAQESEIAITARQNLALQSKPDYDSDVLGVFQRGQEAAAFGRDEAGAWLHIADGWVIAKNVDAAGDVMDLPVTTNAVTVKAATSRSLRSGPDGSFDATGNLPSGETALALGRNGGGGWLQVADGWIPADQVEISGDVMALPITFSSITIRANINVALRRGPSRDAEVMAILARGESAAATSRNEAGTAVQTPRGWVFINRGLALEGEVMELPLAPTVSVTAAQALTLYSKASQNSDRLLVVPQGEQDIAFGRDETGIWLQIPGGWVSTEQGLGLDGDVMDLPITGRSGITITITATHNISVRTGPSGTSDRVGRLQRSEEALAIGRNEDGTRLQIESGWVLASFVKANGDIMDLPITSGESRTQSVAKTSPRDSVTITANLRIGIRSGPSEPGHIGFLQRGEEAIAFGRNEKATRLQIESGWVLASSVKADGDIMDLPVTSSTVARTATTTTRATPTPSRSSSSTSAFNEQSIRSRVNRYTDDIRILKISQRGSTTSIEYDLKSWFLVPNESIAKEVVFKMICALRRGGQIPHKLEFIGQGNFKSDVGRKFRSPSVEIHISANNANRIVCSGNNYTDINWRSLSSFYKSYPIPRGATVDD